MIEKKEKKHGAKKKRKEKQDWPLPYCTTAPAPEHFRGADEDEPCDDARAIDMEPRSLSNKKE